MGGCPNAAGAISWVAKEEEAVVFANVTATTGGVAGFLPDAARRLGDGCQVAGGGREGGIRVRFGGADRAVGANPCFPCLINACAGPLGAYAPPTGRLGLGLTGSGRVPGCAAGIFLNARNQSRALARD